MLEENSRSIRNAFSGSRFLNHNHGRGHNPVGGRGPFPNSKPELSRGPRSKLTSPSPTKPDLSPHIRVLRRHQFNKSDFQTHYPNSKFYVIKSYSEDDIHKSIKYSVWASTPYGNRKLDAAFHHSHSEPEYIQCPLFLFFSVNGSGQFVGIAEMIGKVDFNKDMDFWQAEKWNGFFPVQWHIIKDLPNSELRHIILDDCDDGHRDVTFTRDTHEIGLQQGLEMLHIFKSYDAKTSLLDDFNFYETREKSLRMKRSCSSKPEYETYDDDIHSYKYNNTIPLTETETRTQMCVDNNNNMERSMEDLTIPAAATPLSNHSLNDSSA